LKPKTLHSIAEEAAQLVVRALPIKTAANIRLRRLTHVNRRGIERQVGRIGELKEYFSLVDLFPIDQLDSSV
jgi:hypothetical protein